MELAYRQGTASMLKKLEQRQFVTLPVALHNRNWARVISSIAHSCDPIHCELVEFES